VTYLYLIYDFTHGNTKIGVSNNPGKRCMQLYHELSVLKVDLVVLAGIPLDNARDEEFVLHDVYKSKWVMEEWYELSEQDINDILARYGLEPLFPSAEHGN
jgi:hypothetical protein